MNTRHLWFTAGATLTILTWMTWKPALAWALTHNPPVTPNNWAPKHRTWKNGNETNERASRRG